jgi:hypothetical protein
MNGKLDVGRVFERVFAIYRDQFALLIPAALILFVPVALLTGAIFSGTVGPLELALVLAVGAIAGYWFQAMVVEAARDILDGRRDHTLGTLLRSVAPVLGPLIVAGILAGIAVGIGYAFLVVPGLFLATIWAVIAPVIVIERRRALEAFGRSRELVRGHGWQVFAVIAILFVLQIVITGLVRVIVDNVDEGFLAYTLSELIVRLVLAPLSALAAAVLFFELKDLRGEPVLADGAEVAAPPAPPAPPPPAAPTTGTEDPGSSPPG